MKRFAVILLLLLSSCGRHDGRIPIEFWTLQLSPAFDEHFRGLIREYERGHPGVRIVWVDVPYDAAVQKLLSAAVAGTAPDVVNLSADFLAKFHGMGALADLSVPLRTCGYTFLPNALNLCTYDSAVVALPWYLNSYVAIYNKALFHGAGMDSSDVPSTFDGLLRFVEEYKDRTGRFALYWNIGKDSYLPMMLESEGVPMVNAEMTEAAFASPRGIELVDRWVQLYRNGYFAREMVNKPGSTIVEAYQSGQAALIFTGPVFLKRIETNAPGIFVHTGVASVITGTSGRHDLAAMALSVLTTSRHPAEAAEFAFFVTSPANQLAFSRLTTTFPSVTEALRDTFFRSSDGTLTQEARRLGAAQLPSATRLRTYLDHPEFDALRDAFDEAVQQACLGTVSTREALEHAAAVWNGILGKGR